jgi:hypothetical protein
MVCLIYSSLFIQILCNILQNILRLCFFDVTFFDIRLFYILLFYSSTISRSFATNTFSQFTEIASDNMYKDIFHIMLRVTQRSFSTKIDNPPFNPPPSMGMLPQLHSHSDTHLLAKVSLTPLATYSPFLTQYTLSLTRSSIAHQSLINRSSIAHQSLINRSLAHSLTHSHQKRATKHTTRVRRCGRDLRW